MARRRKRKVVGVCRICGQQGELEREHVPPQKAFNKASVIEHPIANRLFPSHNKKPQIRQGGCSSHTLCKQCNNNTGAWYASEYVKWAQQCSDILQHIKQSSEHFGGDTQFWVQLDAVYPLRFLKQVVTCFFSVVNSPGAEFATQNPRLVEFVLNKHETYLPPEHRFFLKLYSLPTRHPPELRRYPVAGRIPVTQDKQGRILEMGKPITYAEMAHPPFDLIMTDTDYPGATEITDFKNYGYDQVTDLGLYLTVGRSLFQNFK